MKGNIFFIFLLILFVGCDRRSKEKKFLTGNNYKFWDFYRNGYLNAFCFHEDGRFYVYNYTYLGSRMIFHVDDEKWPDSWILIGDDSLVTNGDDYKIVQLTEDSLKLDHKGIWNNSFSCWKSPNQSFK